MKTAAYPLPGAQSCGHRSAQSTCSRAGRPDRHLLEAPPGGGRRHTCCLASMGRMTSATCRDSRFHLSSLSLWHCRRTSVNISSTCGDGPDARTRPACPRVPRTGGQAQRGHSSGLPRLQPEESQAHLGLGQSTRAAPTGLRSERTPVQGPPAPVSLPLCSVPSAKVPSPRGWFTSEELAVADLFGCDPS